jgi:hypothetical protein
VPNQSAPVFRAILPGAITQMGWICNYCKPHLLQRPFGEAYKPLLKLTKARRVFLGHKGGDFWRWEDLKLPTSIKLTCNVRCDTATIL